MVVIPAPHFVSFHGDEYVSAVRIWGSRTSSIPKSMVKKSGNLRNVRSRISGTSA